MHYAFHRQFVDGSQTTRRRCIPLQKMERHVSTAAKVWSDVVRPRISIPPRSRLVATRTAASAVEPFEVFCAVSELCSSRAHRAIKRAVSFLWGWQRRLVPRQKQKVARRWCVDLRRDGQFRSGCLKDPHPDRTSLAQLGSHWNRPFADSNGTGLSQWVAIARIDFLQ